MRRYVAKSPNNHVTVSLFSVSICLHYINKFKVIFINIILVVFINKIRIATKI